jgi:hypothetical protein
MTTPVTAPSFSPTRVLVAVAGAVTVIWSAVVLVWRDAPFALTFDDAFYYFGIARNVAAGHGSTFDGLNLTNGYHPLWMLLATPVYALGLDGTDAARALLALQVLCYGGALALVGVVGGRAIGDWPRLRDPGGDRTGAARWCTAVTAGALFVAAVNPAMVRIFANGLESGVLVLVDACLLALAAGCRGRFVTGTTGRDRLLVSAVLVLVVLARTDSVLLVGALGLWSLAEAWPLGRRAVRPLAELFALPVVVTVLYLVSNQLWFGVPLQISGLTKRAPLTAGRALTFAGVLAAAAAIGWWGWRRRARTDAHGPRGRFRRAGGFASTTAWYASFCLVVVAYYQVLQTQQWLWYYCPLALYVLFLVVLGVADFAEGAVLEAPPDRSPARAVTPVAAILLVPLVGALWLQTRTFADPNQRSIEVANRDAGRWIDANLPPDAVLASWDAGVVGYYANRPVMNLDGVANSKAYYDASRNGRVGAFLTEHGLTGIVNHGTPVDGEDPDVRAFLTDTLGADAASRAVVVQRWPFTFSGVTTGAGGTVSGTRELDVFLYSLR